MQSHLITGGAGFIAVNLARRLIEAGDAVVAVDDLSRGKLQLLEEFQGNQRFYFRQLDCSDHVALSGLLKEIPCKVDHVWHMAANSDIPAGIADPAIDLERTFLTTFGVIQAMRICGVKNLHFASSSAIYGDLGENLIHEDIGPLQPISNYGAMKLASEAQIRAAVEAFLPRASVFRFPNVIGVPATHGVILDFVRKLKSTPNRLEVLGNGTQQKSYLHVDDLIDAMLHISKLPGRYVVFNIGPQDEGITVAEIAEAVRDRISRRAAIVFGEGSRGWIGDVPKFRYSTQRLSSTGWLPRRNSAQAIRQAVDEIAKQELAL